MEQANGAEFDRLYNNRARVPDYADYFARWAQASAVARQAQPGLLDVAYGSGPFETLDIFPASGRTAGGAPVLVFLHGGYWRSLDKADHAFIAPVFTQCGTCVVIPNYALCPSVSVADIVLQMVRAVAWTHRHISAHGGDPGRITVAGHSAGGHLAAMLLACLWPAYAHDLPARLIKNALSISGLYELRSVLQTPSLQQSLHLDAAHVARLSPAWLPAPVVMRGRGLLNTVVGGAESAAFLQHNALLQRAWGRQVVPVAEVLPGLNHFSILDTLAQPDQRLHQLARGLLFS